MSETPPNFYPTLPYPTPPPLRTKTNLRRDVKEIPGAKHWPCHIRGDAKLLQEKGTRRHRPLLDGRQRVQQTIVQRQRRLASSSEDGLVTLTEKKPKTKHILPRKETADTGREQVDQTIHLKQLIN